MKKELIIVLLTIVPFFATAQFGNVRNKLKAKVNQRVDNRIDKAIDKTLDKVEGNEMEAASNDAATNETSSDKPKGIVQRFSKYDFVPGDKILYYDNFQQEAIGELPAGWNTNGSGEVVTLEKFSGKWLQLHNPFTYLTGNTKETGDDYTAEFDLILQLKNNGWMYPTFSAGLFATNGEPGTSNVFLKEYNSNTAVVSTIHPAENSTSRVQLAAYSGSKSYFDSEAKTYGDLDKYYGKPVHVAMQIQKQRFRMWINETKVFDIPRAIDTSFKMNQLLFLVGKTNYNEEQYGIYISNIKLATGQPDTRHRLIEEGKFTTTGILFDQNSAVIKPESYGVVKDIAAVLKENPSIKIKVIGHTSSDGDDKANLELSKKRSSAVKEMLVTRFDIDGSDIETEGKGEAQPIADNKTKEGQAQNRRVEFIKQ